MFRFFKTGIQKVKTALKKTRSVLGSRIQALFGKPWDESTLDALEEILYEADLGTACIQEFLTHLRADLRFSPQTDIDVILSKLREKSLEILHTKPTTVPSTPKEGEPLVILVIGINGSGKTTTIAKLALHFQQLGKKILLGAGDTFRAGAINQLSIWADRLGTDIVKSAPGADPASVAFDAVKAGITRKTDVILLDTAGRLQNKTDLMQELEKTKRICRGLLPGAPHEVFLVLDATTGQNALDQARIFHKHIPLTGIVLTKLDGSAKGGIILSIYKELGIPIRFVGVGEQAEDLISFDPETYVEALLSTED